MNRRERLRFIRAGLRLNSAFAIRRRKGGVSFLPHGNSRNAAEFRILERSAEAMLRRKDETVEPPPLPARPAGEKLLITKGRGRDERTG